MHAEAVEHIALARQGVEMLAPYLRYIPLAPLVGVLFHIFLGDRLGRRAVGLVACGSVAVSLALAATAFLAVSRAPAGMSLVDPVYQWISSGDFSATVSFRVDA